MNLTESILRYRQYLKRRNLAPHTIKNYLHRLRQFAVWAVVPMESITPQDVKGYVDVLLEKNLSAQTINAHIIAIRSYYDFLENEEKLSLPNPAVKRLALRLPKPLPQHLRDSDVEELLKVIEKARDKALFMLMLRCGLRVEEVAQLTLGTIDYQHNQIMIKSGKGAKDRVAYISNDAAEALAAYLRKRPKTKVQQVFLVEKGRYKGAPISVRGIQKRIEYYSKKSGIAVSCHRLRHTMATQLLNADADLVTIQDLLGHNRIETTQRYSKLSNLKAQRDYYKAMDTIMEKTERNILTKKTH